MSSPIPPTAPVQSCPACGEPGSGRFCAACGAPLGGAACAGCGAALTPGAKFCHRCGTPAGAAARPLAAAAPVAPVAPAAPVAPSAPAAPNARPASGTVLPWAVAFVALLALAAMAAGRNFRVPTSTGLDAPLNALPQASLGEVPGVPPAGQGGMPAGSRAPDLSQMSPREIADRLFDRVMSLSAEGKPDSAAFFATMALQNYANMGALDLDLRYDMGRVAEVAGRRDIVQAQSDSILRQSPTHLLGLVLAAKGAAMAGDAPARTRFHGRLVAAVAAERAKNLEEYQRHNADIDAALSEARKP